MNSKTSFFGIQSIADLAKVAVVAALYVVVTIVLAPFSFGAYQLRLSETFNHLALFNKRYVLSVTLGVAIANITSPLGIIDIVWGSFQTLVMLMLIRFLTKHVSNLIIKMIIAILVTTFMMWMIALELAWVGNAAFWPTFWAAWLSTGIGELLSMTVGAILVYFLNKAVDLRK
ncbi:QueT transporter family protein [Paucilactobacillus kaifaensis]|uniref:QueT transporter family protein n=1 Tax=Paucilactobacillus kaifaensis TaxID=2559921 RepID=UPI0010F78BCB|nr:QueT transporter family protein [Paucilactobacillus kaifaensis]